MSSNFPQTSYKQGKFYLRCLQKAFELFRVLNILCPVSVDCSMVGGFSTPFFEVARSSVRWCEVVDEVL